MRLFLDTDVLLDVLLERQPHLTASARILDWAEANPGQCAVSWHGLANIHYLSKNGADDFIRDLLGFAEIPRTGTDEMHRALNLGFADLEDAMQVSTAIAFRADSIVTRNLPDYRLSPVRAVSPAEIVPLL